MHLRFAAAVGLFLHLTVGALANGNSTTWIMLDVSPAQYQADCHLLRMPDGTNILIDIADAADAPNVAVPTLQRLGVRHVGLVVISHFHKDHYNRLLDLIKSGVVVDRVAVNVPDKRAAALESPSWGCDLDDVQRVLAELRAHKVPYFTPKAGDRLFECKASDGALVSLDVLCAYDGFNTPVGVTDVNDTSIVLRLSHGPTRALFTGDLNSKLGNYLVQSGMDLRADILKAPHHGGEGTVPNSFYEAVHAKALLVPTSKALWLSPRCMRTRNFFFDTKCPVYVAGIRGSVTVAMNSAGYRIILEH